MQAKRFTKRWKKSDAGWLSLAVMVHAAVVLWPMHFGGKTRVLVPSLTVSLVPFRTPSQKTVERLPEPAPQIPDNREFVTPAAKPTPSRPQNAIRTPVKPSPEEPADEAAVTPPLSIASLIESAYRADLDKPDETRAQTLGVHTPQPLPANWRRGAGAPGLMGETNLFDGMVAPDSVEIVDRWIAADGSHNVVVNLPGGETMCGRAEAWDPLQPLVEHIMMFRNCGGGGKRTFSMASVKTPEFEYVD